MGTISATMAMMKVQKLKKGGVAKLSIADISYLITNLSDAKANLPKEQFEQVYKLFKEFQSCTTKNTLDIYGYLDTALKIIERYDAIAPYEKYGGGNEIEFSFMMEDLRKGKPSVSIEEEMIKLAASDKSMDVAGYSNYIVDNSNGTVSSEIAKAFVGVLVSYSRAGKATALDNFDKLMNYEINKLVKEGSLYSSFMPGFLCGLLYPNGIVTKAESDALSKKYFDLAQNIEIQSLNH